MSNTIQRQTAAGWLLAAPALLGLALFVAGPFFMSVVLSFTSARLGSPLPTEFVGVDQYARVLSDETFRRALANNALFALIVVPVQTALALALALALNRSLRGIGLLRSLFFMPVVFPFALLSVVWTVIYAPGPNGFFNALLDTLTFGAWEPRDFLHNSAWAFPAIMIMSIWQGVGFQMMLFLAGLQGIPRELYEAAAIDGASRWRQFWRVTLPQLRNTTLFVALVTAILALRLFDQVQIMTRGGPEDATTTVIFEAVRASFERQQIGMGAAMTVVFFVAVLLLTLLQRRFVREERSFD